MKELTTAPDREVEELEDATGIYVRARFSDGTFGNVDIAQLDAESLDHWLRSRDSIEWPVSVVKILLGHRQGGENDG